MGLTLAWITIFWAAISYGWLRRQAGLRIFHRWVLRCGLLFLLLGAAIWPLRAEEKVDTTAGFIRFIDAARTGDAEAVRRILDTGMDVNRDDMFGQTALFHALHAGQMEMACLLIEAGADLEKSVRGEPMLSWVVALGDTRTVRAALARLVSIRRPGETEIRALKMAARWGRLENFKKLEKHGIVWNVRRAGSGKAASVDGGAEMLLAAAEGGSAGMISHILAQGVPARTQFSRAVPLNAAVQSGEINAVRVLLDAGADPNQTGSTSTPYWCAAASRSPLTYAVIFGEHDMISLLLERGADPRGQNNEAILWADFSGDAKASELL